MYTVAQLLQQKGSTVWTVSPQATMYDALELLASKNVGALVVVRDGRVVGILSERDYARKVILKGKSSRDLTVAELMTTDVLYVTLDDTIESCMALMTQKHFRHLPVLDGGKLAGLVSIGDVVKAVISDHEIIIRELERYIHGGHTSLP